MTARAPALLVAAPASGQGKTTFTAALARLHTRAGRKVRVFKCGPDFLDPFWHSLASGAPVHQIDLWMTGEADIRSRLHQAASEADLILVEGVMGLFDGHPSSADLAQRFGLPVMAVIDASHMAGTFGAVAYGLRHYRPEMPWAGVMANLVASDGHAQMLADALQASGDFYGALTRNEALVLPERHLGLTVATELTDAMKRLDAAADALAQTPLGQLSWVDWQRWAVDFAPVEAEKIEPTLAGQTVAVASDKAFCFIYAANLQTLESLGARVQLFSPLADEALPECDALWLPGGYPELHTDALVANAGMRASLAAHIAAGKPVWAECGGMMALFDEIELKDGTVKPAWGLMPGRTVMQPRLAALGPQQLALPEGTLRGHTFHYSKAQTELPEEARTARPNLAPTATAGEAVYRFGSVRASYFHAWFASSPGVTAALLTGQPETCEALA